MIDYSKIDAKAILIPDRDGSREALDQMEMEEYEYDIVWSPEKRLWVTTLVNGNYLINVKAKGFKEINNVVRIDSNSPVFFDF